MRLLKLIAAIFCLFATPAIAGGRDGNAWTVSQKSGQVHVIRAGMQPASLSVRAKVMAGDVLATGADGRAMLSKGNDYVVVAPNSRLQVPAGEQPSGFTRLVQQLGTMFYKVKHTGVPHFSVEAPMLAAVVKGTSFTIIVDEDRNVVQVTDGIVEVSSASGASRRLVQKGQTVVVGQDRPDEIVELTADTSIPSSDGGSAVYLEASGDVPLRSIVERTGGLLIEEAVAVTGATRVTGFNDPLTPLLGVVNDKTAAEPPTLAVIDPLVAVGPVSAPTVTVASNGIPSVTVSPVTIPGVTVAPISTPIVTTPVVSAPTVAAPTVTAPVVMAPPVTAPVVTAPMVTVPTVPTIPVAPVIPTPPTIPPPPPLPPRLGP